tara:strand:+ start:253 stop:465 length:213 start_codon:yes stop_codon:yes gene_type:complete
MTIPNCIKDSREQLKFLKSLVEEAEFCQNPDHMADLYRLANNATTTLSQSLETHLKDQRNKIINKSKTAA